MRIRTVVLGLILSLGLAPIAFGEGSATIAITAARPGVKVSPSLYGIFFEDINRAVDGGIYAEMVQNRAFEDSDDTKAWPRVLPEANSGYYDVVTSIVREQPLNDQSPRSLRLKIAALAQGRAGIANRGFGGIVLKKGATYTLSFYARGSEDFKGALTASLEKVGLSTIYASQQIDGITGQWKRFTCELTCNADDANSWLVISTKSTGTLWFDCVSLFPKDTWKGRPNGWRPDLAQMLVDLKPAFVRFPGGCYVEGDTLKDAYRWKQTIGDIAIRPGQSNLWRYRSSDGLGYHEYLQFCEDIGATALFVINCGMSHKQNVPMDQMGE